MKSVVSARPMPGITVNVANDLAIVERILRDRVTFFAEIREEIELREKIVAGCSSLGCCCMRSSVRRWPGHYGLSWAHLPNPS